MNRYRMYVAMEGDGTVDANPVAVVDPTGEWVRFVDVAPTAEKADKWIREGLKVTALTLTAGGGTGPGVADSVAQGIAQRDAARSAAAHWAREKETAYGKLIEAEKRAEKAEAMLLIEQAKGNWQGPFELEMTRTRERNVTAALAAMQKRAELAELQRDALRVRYMDPGSSAILVCGLTLEQVRAHATERAILLRALRTIAETPNDHLHDVTNCSGLARATLDLAQK